MPKVQSQSQKSEALFKLVWTTVQLSKHHGLTVPSMGRNVKHSERSERLNIMSHNIMYRELKLIVA